MLSKTQILILLVMFIVIYVPLSTSALSYYTTIKADAAGLTLKYWPDVLGIQGLPVGIEQQDITQMLNDDYLNIAYPEVQETISTMTMIAWINALLFVPFVLILGWIFASSLPTVNGGG